MPPLPRVQSVPPQPGPQQGPLPIVSVPGPSAPTRIPIIGGLTTALAGASGSGLVAPPHGLSSLLVQTDLIGFSYVTGVNGFRHTFPVPFPNGLATILYTVSNFVGATSVVIVEGGTDRGHAQFLLFNGAVEAASGNYHLIYLALGW
jgi:hypothetical protein